MDFRPSQEQLELQQGIRTFCEQRISLDVLRQAESTEGFDGEVWCDLSALGVFQVGLSEKQGGLGLGRADLALVFEELGRCLAPGPLIFTELAAGRLSGAESGGCVVGGLDLRGVKPGPVLVSHWSSLDSLMTLRDEGVYVLEVGGVEAKRIENSMDPLTPIHQVEALPLGDEVGDASLANLLGLRGQALASAFALGMAGATLDLALAYAKEREQFDRPIGSFQSIKHMLADMFARLELARAAVYAAGATLDFPEAGHPERAVCAASICAADSAMKNARACIQVLGGMGYTWEVAAHYYLKRCWVLESMFGPAEKGSDRIAEMLGAETLAGAKD